MYPEFIAIYAGLLVVIGLLVAILCLQIRVIRNGHGAAPAVHQTQNFQQSGTVVFCRNCAAQFDSSQRVCPKCGTPR